MSSTRRASKRARLARRDENDQMRTARRDSLTVLLARLARGIAPTPDEAALLRAAVEAEIREGDAARASERGQQRAMDRERERVAAAEAAIVELEAERDAVNEALGLAPGQLPGTAPSAIRGRAATIREQAQRAEEAEAEAERFKADYLKACQTIAAMHEAATGRTGEGPVRGVVEDVADMRARAVQAAADVENLTTAHAEQQKMHDARRRDLADALGRSTGTAWPELIEHAAEEQRAARQWEEQAQLHARAAEQADAVTAETKQLMQRRTTTLRDRAQRAERRNADVRHYIESVYPGDIAEGVRVDLRRLLNGLPPTYGPSGQPEVITDRAAIRATLDEPEPKPAYDCPHCPDGHTPPTRGSQPWSAWIGPERDGDGQPTTIHVARSAGAHVAESDAQWVRDRLNAQEQPR